MIQLNCTQVYICHWIAGVQHSAEMRGKTALEVQNRQQHTSFITWFILYTDTCLAYKATKTEKGD